MISNKENNSRYTQESQPTDNTIDYKESYDKYPAY